MCYTLTMKWKITYFNVKVRDSLLKWPKKILARYLKITDLIEKNGPNLGMPLTRAMGDGLFELRVKAQEGIGRVFFCTVINNEVVILHSFIKKTQQTPKKELDISKKRMREVNDHEH